ncbi:MAG: VOC family protein [Pseudomonadota bacterium]
MQLNQVTVPCTAHSFAECLTFYEALGLTLIVHTHDRYARFECPDTDAGPPATMSLHVVDQLIGPSQTVVYFEAENLDEAVATARSRGIEFDSGPADQAWLWREARCRDPAGNPICFYSAGQNRRFPPWRRDRG